MDRNVAKMSLMGSIWSKLVIFVENGQNWVILDHFGSEKDSINQNFGKLVKLFCP